MKLKNKSTIKSAILAVSLTMSIFESSNIAYAKELANTGATYVKEVTKDFQSEEICFKNTELKEIITNIIGVPITISKLNTITNLNIETTLKDTNLSDLKYLTNLSELIISNNYIDCSYLKDNLKLTNLVMKRCVIKNTSELPSSLRGFQAGSCTINDETLYLKENICTLALSSTDFKKIKLTNPEKLLTLYYSNYALLDMKIFEDCYNLQNITLRHCPNVTNAYILNNFTKAQNMSLDEYAALWIDKETISNLNTINQELKDTILELIDELDIITSQIITEDMNEEKKINSIIAYVLSEIEYDDKVKEPTEEGVFLSHYYNDYPLSTSLEGDYGVCVNYAVLFKALANRCGIDNYQPSSKTHTWNMVRLEGDLQYKAYDLTRLDYEKAIILEYDILKQQYYQRLYNTSTITYINNGDTSKLCYYNFDYQNIEDEAYANSIIPSFSTYYSELPDKEENISDLLSEDYCVEILKTSSTQKICSASLILLAANLLLLNRKYNKNKKETIKRLTKKGLH